MSQLTALSCCSAVHCQQSEALSVLKWGCETLLQLSNVFCVAQNVCISQQISLRTFCPFWGFIFMFYWFQTFAMFWMLYDFFLGNSPVSEFCVPKFWNAPSVPSHLSRLRRQVGMKNDRVWEMCFEMLAHKIRMPGNYPEESRQYFFAVITDILWVFITKWAFDITGEFWDFWFHWLCFCQSHLITEIWRLLYM